MVYPATPTFWIDPTGQTERARRRYSSRDRHNGDPFDCPHGYHEACIWVDRVPTETYLDKDGARMRREVPQFDKTDGQWPTKCDHCGNYEFDEQDYYQTFTAEVYKRVDTGEEYILHPKGGRLPVAPPGAMWHAYWYPPDWRAEDGISLMVRLADEHDWAVDTRASNCDQPDRPHKCWIRHGDPRTDPITVDKAGDTCNAGAGSILAEDYHGFLQQGVLTPG